jgi:signal transduction histidine kinase
MGAIERADHRSSSRFALLQVTLMAAVVAAFVVDTVVDLHAGDELAGQVTDITSNTLPSVAFLAKARGDVRRIHYYVRRSLRAVKGLSPRPPRELDRLRRELDESLARYLSLPVLSGERQLYEEIAEARTGIDERVDETLAAADKDDLDATQASVQGAVSAMDRLDDALERLQNFHAEQGRRIGLRLTQFQKDGAVRTLVVDVALAILAMAATVLAAIAWLRSVAALHERTSELDMFAGRAAHDLMSPLTTVGMGLSLSKKRLAGDAAAVATIERAERSLVRARSLVDGLLAFARAGGPVEAGGEADVGGEIRGVLDGLEAEAAEAGVQVSFECSGGGWVACPPGVLASLTQNLVQNAIKYTGLSERRRVAVRVQAAAARARVVVEDTGPGVSEQIRATIFHPFVRGTGDLPGLGLGLATVKRLAEAYGGDVGCRSTPGVGSVFWFELPWAHACATRSSSETTRSSSSTRRRKPVDCSPSRKAVTSAR